MEHAITVVDVLKVVVIGGGVLIILAALYKVLAAIGSGFSR